ncbi:182 kDa tankyrase-1-binding protein isoform 1-T2 [Anableps anableps]
MESTIEASQSEGLPKTKPALPPKPGLAPKPFSRQKSSTIRSISAPKTAPKTPPKTTPTPKSEARQTEKSEAKSPLTIAVTTPAEKLPQPTSASAPKPQPASVLPKSQPEATKASEAPLQNEDSFGSKTAAPDPASETTPHKEEPKSETEQKDNVIETNHSIATIAVARSEQKDGEEKQSDTEVSVSQKMEESSNNSSFANNSVYQRASIRKRLPKELTSKFESGGVPLPPQPLKTISKPITKDDSDKPESSNTQQGQATPEPPIRESDTDAEDFTGGNSIKQRISLLFDSVSKPEVTTKREEPEITNGIGGVKEQIKNWVAETGPEDQNVEKKPQAAPRVRSKGLEPVAKKSPETPRVEVPAAEETPTQPVDPHSTISSSTGSQIEPPKEAKIEDKSLENATETPAETDKPKEDDLHLQRNHLAAADEKDLAVDSELKKKKKANRRSVRFGTVVADDGGPPVMLSPEPESSEDEKQEEDAEVESKEEEEAAVPMPLYRRVGILQRKDKETQRREALRQLQLEQRQKEEENEQARLKMEEEQKRMEEEEAREKEKARQKELERNRLEEERREMERLREEQIENERQMELLRQKQIEEERERERVRLEEERKEARMREERERQRQKKEEERLIQKQRLEEEQRQKELELMKRTKEEERLRQEELEKQKLRQEEEERERLRRLEEEEERKRRELEEQRRKELELMRQRREEEERLRQEELEKQRLRQEEEERERLRRLEEEEERKRRELEEQRRKELELMRQRKEEEERLRQEELEKQKLRQEEEENRRQQEEERLRREDEERKRRELERKMQQEKEEEKERLRKEQIKIQMEKERAEELKRKMEEDLERQKQLRTDEENDKGEENLINFDAEEPPFSPSSNISANTETLVDVAYDDFSVQNPLLDVDFDDFSVKPRRWASQPRRETAPISSDWRVEPVDKDNWLVSFDSEPQESQQENIPKQAEKQLVPSPAPESPEKEKVKMLLADFGVTEEEERPVEDQFESGEMKEEEQEEMENGAEDEGEEEDNKEPQVNIYPTDDEDKPSEVLLDTEQPQRDGVSEQTCKLDSPAPVPDPVPDVSSEDVDNTNSQRETDLAAFPEISTPLLDTSTQRSKAVLSRRRTRSRPSRSLRLGSIKAARVESSVRDGEKENESDSEEEPPKSKPVSSPPTSAPKVAMFPGLSPAALLAGIKKKAGGGATEAAVEGAAEDRRGQEKESQNKEAALSPSQVSGSPRLPAHLAGAARVLPPIGSKDGGKVSSPAWLKELKSKKRMSQHNGET